MRRLFAFVLSFCLLALGGCAVHVNKSQHVYVYPADDEGDINVNQDGVWTSDNTAEQLLEGQADVGLNVPLP